MEELIAMWEERFARVYESRGLADRHRAELHALRDRIRAGDTDGARPLLEERRRYHLYTGDFADTLHAGFSHHELSDLYARVLAALDAPD